MVPPFVGHFSPLWAIWLIGLHHHVGLLLLQSFQLKISLTTFLRIDGSPLLCQTSLIDGHGTWSNWAWAQHLEVLLHMNSSAPISSYLAQGVTTSFSPLPLSSFLYFILSSFSPSSLPTSSHHDLEALHLIFQPLQGHFSCFPEKLRNPHDWPFQRCAFYHPRMPHSLGFYHTNPEHT